MGKLPISPDTHLGWKFTFTAFFNSDYNYLRMNDEIQITRGDPCTRTCRSFVLMRMRDSDVNCVINCNVGGGGGGERGQRLSKVGRKFIILL